jgi:hypothetical protein
MGCKINFSYLAGEFLVVSKKEQRYPRNMMRSGIWVSNFFAYTCSNFKEFAFFNDIWAVDNWDVLFFFPI